MIEVGGVTYVVLPGPPSELKPMVNNELVPLLATGQNCIQEFCVSLVLVKVN